MGWIESRDAGSDLAGVLGHRPELQAKYQAFMGAIEADEAVPADILRLCKARVEFVHGGEDPKHRDLTDAEACAVKIADLMPHGYHSIEDADVTALVTHFGERGAVNLLTATSFYDVSARLNKVFEIKEQS
ncbi:MAG: hypothetical protein GKR90_08555 [Pseudomonadales bacterium]|nr:hypothetical protein [Pseudomonadales bacterium]